MSDENASDENADHGGDQAPKQPMDGARRDPPRPQQQAPGVAEPTAKPKRRIAFVIFGVLVLAAAAAGVVWWFAHRNEISTDDAFTDGRAISIAPRVSGNVVALDVNDNQFVHAGQRLIKIDPRDYIAARDQVQGQLLATQAQIVNARANLKIANVTQPAKLEQARAQLASAEASEIKARRDFARFHAIDPAATTRQDIDTATANERQAAAQVALAKAQVDQASTVVDAIQQAQAQIKQLQGQTVQSRAQLDQADLNLGYTDVVAPQDGWVTRRNVEQGTYVQTGTTIFSIVTPDVWITANFKEDELSRMRPGDPVRIRVDAYPWLKLEGHVDSVQLGSGSKFSAFPAENATGNYVKIVQRVPVKIVIDRGLDPKLPLPLGISVVPTVELKADH